jgi:hypothetical protein
VVFSINKTDCHDIIEILLKVALNTIKQNQTKHGSSCKTLHQTLTTKYMYIINTMFIKRKDKIDFFKPLGVKIFMSLCFETYNYQAYCGPTPFPVPTILEERQCFTA